MAKSALRNMAFLADNDEQTPKELSRMTVEDSIRLFMSDGMIWWKSSTEIFYKQRFAVIGAIVSANRIQYVDELKPKFARQMWGLRLTQVSGPTVHHEETVLKMLTRWCAANEHIDRDPLESYKALPMKE